MEVTFLLTDIREIEEELVNFLFENGFDDATAHSTGGRGFLSLDDEHPEIRLQQLVGLGIKAEIFKKG
jgi:hypothetical protein